LNFHPFENEPHGAKRNTRLSQFKSMAARFWTRET